MNIQALTAIKQNAIQMLREVSICRAPSKRPLPAPNIVELTTCPMLIEATVTTLTGITMPRLVVISDQTPAGQMAEQVREALNNDPMMRDTRLEKFSVRIPRR